MEFNQLIYPLDYFCFLVEYNGELYARDMHFDKNNKVFRDVLIEIITPTIYGFDKEQYLKKLEKSIDNHICSIRYNRYLRIVVTNDEVPGIIEKIKEHKSLPDKDKIYGIITEYEDDNPYIEYEDNECRYNIQICRCERGMAKYDTEDKDYNAITATTNALYAAMKEKENMDIEFKNGNSIKITTENDTGSSFVNNNIDIAKLYPKFTNSDKLVPLTDLLPTTTPFTATGKCWPRFGFAAIQSELIRSMFLTKSDFGVEKVVFNGPVTNITWADDTTTVVKKAEDDPDDREAAIAYAYLKRLYSLIGIKDMDKHLSKLVKEGIENEASIKEKREKRAKKEALAKKKAAAKTETRKPAKPKKENK